MRRALAAAAVTAAVLATPGGASPSEPAPFPYCIVKVWEDGSASFRDAEKVRADRACFRAVSDYVEHH